MRIMLVAPIPAQPRGLGAIPLVLHAQLLGLRPRHEVTFVTVAGPDPVEWQAVDRLRADGLDVHAVRRTEPHGSQRSARRWRFASTWLRGQVPWRTIWFWEPAVQPILDRLLAERSFDVIAVEDNAAAMYRYPTSVPTVLTEHEVRRPRSVQWWGWARENPVNWFLREADWQRWRQYQVRVWRRFDRIQVFTRRDAMSMGAVAPEIADRVRVNPFGIELPPAADPCREEEGTILFVGNFTHPPNVDAALWLAREIMPVLRKWNAGTCLRLVGSYPTAPVRALETSDISVTGPVPAVEPFMERAAVIVAPIRTGGGQRMKVLHGMAMGKAVVTTARGAEGLAIAGRVPPLVVADDAEGLASAVANLLAAPKVRRRIGEDARAFVAEHFSPAAYASRLEATYAEASCRSRSVNREPSC